MVDKLMVALTAVYVVATILICYFNYRSANASREQAAEMRRQYDAENRPYITTELIYEKQDVCRLAGIHTRAVSGGC